MVQYIKINVRHHIIKRKDKNQDFPNTEEVFDKIQHLFIKRKLNKIETEENYLDIIKTINENSHLSYLMVKN